MRLATVVCAELTNPYKGITMDYYKGITNTNVRYEATTPSVSSNGRSASFTMYIEDTTVEIDVDLGYDGNRDEVTIELVYADAYDEDCAACDIGEIDLEEVFVDLSNKYGTIDKAYSLQAKAYQDEMSEY